jgi:hypothetical protein
MKEKSQDSNYKEGRKMRRMILAIIILWMCLPVKVFSAVNNEEIDMSIDAQKVLFDISNSKPGDSFERVLTVQNNQNESFDYNADSNFTEGSKDFYEQLLLKVEDVNGTVLYEGLLSEFSKFASRPLAGGEKEELFFTIKVPEELGNEFQGVFADFQIKLYAEGTIGGILPADGPKIPSIGPGMTDEVITSASAALFTGGMMFYLLQRRKKQMKFDLD